MLSNLACFTEEQRTKLSGRSMSLTKEANDAVAEESEVALKLKTWMA